MKNRHKFLDGESYADEVAEYEKIKDNLPEYLGISKKEWVKLEKDFKVSGLYYSEGLASINQQLADGPGMFLEYRIGRILDSIENLNKGLEQITKDAVYLNGLIKRVTVNRHNRACIERMEILNKIKQNKKETEDE